MWVLGVKSNLRIVAPLLDFDVFGVVFADGNVGIRGGGGAIENGLDFGIELGDLRVQLLLDGFEFRRAGLEFFHLLLELGLLGRRWLF